MLKNTWPKGVRTAIHQHEHEAWNAKHYPGTRQLCCKCEEPTGHCEEDSLYDEKEENIGPFCENCYELYIANIIND